MQAEALQNWLMSSEGLEDEIAALRQWSTRLSFGADVLQGEDEGKQSYQPDWRQLMLAASVLAESEQTAQREAALMIAQAAIVFGANAVVRDAGAVVLTQLSNRRAIDLATQRNLIAPDIGARLGITGTLLATRRALESSIVINDSTVIDGNDFQNDLWAKLKMADWTSATAPTSAGKTYLILNWLLGEVDAKRCRLSVFLAPTRALVSEIEKELLELKQRFTIPDLRVASLPIKQLGDLEAPTLLVFTQERLHLFLNAFETPPLIDITIVDEVHKLSDGSRGVILQDAIERILRTNTSGRFVFLSPQANNPETLLEDAPEDVGKAVVLGGSPTVTQNLIVARQKHRKPMDWTLSLVGDDSDKPIGSFKLHDRPAGQTESKRISFVALALGRAEKGTLVYSNGPADAEKIAQQIYDGLGAIEGDQEGPLDEELKDLSDFCRSSIHDRFQLVHLLKRGVAFHYGNMPSILRGEIERLFRTGKIRFLVCTSTLMEGVNLACRTIIVRGPKKGLGKYMSPQDFWNLAGRAGRWGADFHGNIVCIDPDQERLWPNGIPQKSTYPILRETDSVLSDTGRVIGYVNSRTRPVPSAIDETIEPVAAYLMAWRARTGTILDAPSVKRMSPGDVVELDSVIGEALEEVELPEEPLTAHPSISAIAMQSLLNHFKAYSEPLDWLLPPMPEDENAAPDLKDVFARINDTMHPAFGSDAMQWAAAFTTVDWMRGKKLGYMISGAINRARDKEGDEINYARIIRNTMKFVEEFARFKAPKYLTAYLDVLRFHYGQQDLADEFPTDLPFDLYLEFGVNTQTLLSFIGLGLSRTSAIELNDFLAREDMTEEEALSFLRTGEWDSYDLPKIVKREVRMLVARRTPTVSTSSEEGQPIGDA